MDLSQKSPATSTSETYPMTSAMFGREDDLPLRPPSPTEDGSSEVKVVSISCEKTKHLAYDNTYICMLFMKATDVPPRPAFPTAPTTQETPIATVANVRPGDHNGHMHIAPLISFHRPSLWPTGYRIRVRFGDSTPTLRAWVRAYVQLWSAYANITFEFVDNEPSDVRISFNATDGSWSLIGTQSRGQRRDRATMNLNLTDRTPIDRAQSVILHEFGHALGAIHEHQSPALPIPWNRDAVYAHYRQLGASDDWINNNVLNQPSHTPEIDADADFHSIMIYPFPPTHTQNGLWVDWPRTLSIRDYQRIAMRYPRDPYRVTSFTTNRPSNSPIGWHSIIFDIPRQQPDPPRIAAALCGMDMSNRNGNIRVRTEVSHVQTDQFTVGVGTWGDRIFYNGGVSLLIIPDDEPHFRMGTLTNAGPNSHRIEFVPPFPFGVIPTVFAAFSGIDSGQNWRGALDIHNANHVYFDIQVSTWGSSSLWSTNVQWIAYPSDLPGVEMGTFTGAGGATGIHNLRNRFYNTPYVFTGFQHFDIGPGANARLRVRATAANPNQINWAIDTWADSMIYTIIGIFLAISPGGCGSR